MFEPANLFIDKIDKITATFDVDGQEIRRSEFDQALELVHESFQNDLVVLKQPIIRRQNEIVADPHELMVKATEYREALRQAAGHSVAHVSKFELILLVSAEI